MSEPVMQLGPGQKYCSGCAHILAAEAAFCARCGAPQQATGIASTGRSKIAAALLAFFLGGLGAHKFYLGRWGWGIVYLLFSWTLIPGLVAFVEFILLLVMDEETFHEKYPGNGNAGVVVAVMAAALFGFIVVVGILAAIAIPNFIRYQLRSKQAGVRAELVSLFKAEEAQAQAGRVYVTLDGFPAEAELGAEKLLPSQDDLALASDLGWALPEHGLFGRYSVAVLDSPDGLQSMSLCAESDLDGDEQVAAFVAFRPALRGQEVVLEAPAAPCVHQLTLADGASLEYDPAIPPGQLVQVTPQDVF